MLLRGLFLCAQEDFRKNDIALNSYGIKMGLTPKVSLAYVVVIELQKYIIISFKYKFLCIYFIFSCSFSYGSLRIGCLH